MTTAISVSGLVKNFGATRALDRVLLAGSYVVPSYALRKERIAHWDRFSHAEHIPDYPDDNVGFPIIWWYDEAKAAKTGGGS